LQNARVIPLNVPFTAAKPCVLEGDTTMSVGERAAVTPELLRILRERYGIWWHGEVVDLGGSVNLNIRLPADDGGYVARLYAPWTSPARISSLRLARSHVAQSGLPIPQMIATRDGAAWMSFDGRVLEVERYVSGQPMDTWDRLLQGMGVLGQIHQTLQGVDVGAAGCEAPYANYVAADSALERTRDAAARIGAEGGSPAELRLAQLAQKLALELQGAELERAVFLPQQLVHGDFWDNNVLFRDTELVAVLDFDFMGERARIDDVALILCYMFTTGGFRHQYRPPDRIGKLREIVDAYDAGLHDHLSAHERAALPLALVRNVLPPFCNLWHVRDEAVQREYVGQITLEIEWSLELLADLDQWQRGFA
jgi:homoserine kinase type II